MTGRLRALLPCVVLVSVLAGCGSPAVERHVVYQEVCSGRFVALMRAGETSRAEEQDFIRASERAWHFLRQAMGIEGVKARLEEGTDGEGKTTKSGKPLRRRAR